MSLSFISPYGEPCPRGWGIPTAMERLASAGAASATRTATDNSVRTAMRRAPADPWAEKPRQSPGAHDFPLRLTRRAGDPAAAVRDVAGRRAGLDREVREPVERIGALDRRGELAREERVVRGRAGGAPREAEPAARV